MFRMQSMLLSEWRGRFLGPSQWFWYLSDGGHFEVTGLYELVRRRVPLMIVTDAGHDADYLFDDLGQMIRQVRTDFGAEVAWLDPINLGNVKIPQWILRWLNVDALGTLEAMKRDSSRHAALARVTYPSGNRTESWLLALKPGISSALPQDVLTYAKQNPKFPQDPTLDQVFDDAQWESYRKLGETIASQVIKPPQVLK